MITADAVMRGAKPVQLKAITDKACEIAAKDGFNVQRVVCVARLKDTPRAGQAQHGWVSGRDVWYSDFVAAQAEECECEWMDSEAPLFMLYTSGSTGKPKGVLHTTGGYMLGAFATTKRLTLMACLLAPGDLQLRQSSRTLEAPSMPL